MDSGQQAVIDFLADPATHGLQGPVQRVDTHAAIVFLAGERAYKIKRAVRYPYLDFSTLQQREAACWAEIEANRPFASDLYRGVLAIVRRPDGTLSLGGPGEPVEWAVEMRRFDETATLDHVAGREGISDALARDLGIMVAAGHEKAPPIDAPAWIDALGKFVRDEAAAMRAAPDVVSPADASSLAHALDEALARIRPLLVRRGAEGLVRRGHGDLHLRNIVLIDNKPVAFDALEFDPIVAAGDLLYDLGFLLMDLLARGLSRAANIVFNRYLVAAGRDSDLDALTALPFFLSLRAAIRARVALDRRKQVKGGATDEAAEEARSYLKLALTLIARFRPRLIAVGGLSGTGKSVLAAALAAFIPPAPGAVHLRSDIERKRLFGVGEFDRLPDTAYSPDASERVYARLAELAERVLGAGHSVIVDAVYARAEERGAVEQLAKRLGIELEGLWLEAPLPVRVKRVGSRVGDASDADEKVARAQEQYDPGRLRWQRVDASGSPEAVLSRARAVLGASAGSR